MSSRASLFTVIGVVCCSALFVQAQGREGRQGGRGGQGGGRGGAQAAGLAMDPKGRIVAAQYTKKVSVVYPKGSEETLTSMFEGKPYIRPNDIVADKKGGVYFTDCYQIGAERSPNDLPQAVYHIRPDKKVVRVADDVRRPNGIVLSPDEKTLYVNDWDADSLVSYSVQADGTLKNRKNFG